MEQKPGVTSDMPAVAYTTFALEWDSAPSFCTGTLGCWARAGPGSALRVAPELPGCSWRQVTARLLQPTLGPLPLPPRAVFKHTPGLAEALLAHLATLDIPFPPGAVVRGLQPDRPAHRAVRMLPGPPALAWRPPSCTSACTPSPTVPPACLSPPTLLPPAGPVGQAGEPGAGDAVRPRPARHLGAAWTPAGSGRRGADRFGAGAGGRGGVACLPRPGEFAPRWQTAVRVRSALEDPALPWRCHPAGGASGRRAGGGRARAAHALRASRRACAGRVQGRVGGGGRWQAWAERLDAPATRWHP